MKRLTAHVTTVLSLVLLLSPASCIAASCPDPLAKRFVPAALVELTGNANDVGCVVERIDVVPNGTSPLVAVAYANGAGGGFALLRTSGTDAELLFSTSRAGMLGRDPKIEKEDLDGDGISEMIVSWAGATDLRGTWVFQYRNGQVRSITPTENDDDERSAFEDPFFIDFDGDGRKDALDRVSAGPTPVPESEDEFPVPPYTDVVYTLTENGFTSTPREVAFWGSFFRHEGKPETREQQFTFNGSERALTLRVVNGGTSGNRATSASIRLNGAPLASPDDFKRKEARFEVPVRLIEGENTIVVELAGKPGSEFVVFIY